MTEQRTIQILATVKDLASASLRKVGTTVGSVFSGAQSQVAKFRNELNSIQGAFAAVAAALAVGKGVALFKDLTDGLAAVSRSAEQIGATASSLYLLRNAAAVNGVEFDQLSTALVTFEKAVGAARLGGQEQQRTLQALGLDSEQFAGSQRDLVAQMAQVADAFVAIKDPAERANLASKLFGDSGVKLLPTLLQGGAALRAYALAQKAAGLALTDKDLAAVVTYQRTLAALEAQFRTLAEQVVVAFAPALTKALDDISKAVANNGPAIKAALGGIFDTLVFGLDVLLSVANLITQTVAGWRILAGSAEAAYFAMGGGSDKDYQTAVGNLKQITRDADAAEKGLFKISDALDLLRRTTREQFRVQPVTKSTPDGIVDPTNIQPPAPKVQASYDKFWDGFKAGAKQSLDALLDFRAQGMAAAQQLINSGINGITNALADVVLGTKTAAEAFRELAKSILTELLKIIIKLLLIRAIESGLNLFSGASATPGAATAPSTTSLGVTLAPDSLPLGNGSGSLASTLSTEQSTTVNYNITAMDGQDVSRVLLRNRDTLRAIAQQDIARNRSTRQVVQGVR